MTVLVALLVCLIPTTIGGLLSAIGIAGMDRMIQANVIAMSGRAVEAAGDVDVLLLDKTGTITLGNRQAVEFVPARDVDLANLADAAQLASLADETPEGRSVVVLAKEKYGLRGRNVHELGATFIPFSAQTRLSGVDFDGRQIRKGAARASSDLSTIAAALFPTRFAIRSTEISRKGGTPLVVADGANTLGVIYLKDIVKGGIKERFTELRRMGIKTVMITGDNPQTAAAIAAEAGVDDFLAEATPEAKLQDDSRLPGGRPAGGHDRRRHERLPGASPGRRCRGNELRHASREGSRQHGRPRLEPDEADRDRRDRQAALDDPRLAHDVQPGERRGQVLRDHPGRVRHDLSGARSSST